MEEDEEEDWDMALPEVVGVEGVEDGEDDDDEEEDVIVYDPRRRFAALGLGKKAVPTTI